ncbi:MAG TPA: hypothetical protein VK660_03580 [Xanthomonadaceae bacterium]|nr:hypothetical protein [Xanthomonadaceae bacterium]
MFILVILGTIVFTTVGILVMRSVIHHHVAEGHNDVIVPMFLTAGTIYAVFLAFLVVAVWETYDAAHDNIADEASALATLYRASTGMEKESGAHLRLLVREYTEAVITDEWPIQAATAGASPKARAIGLEMYRLFSHLDPAVRQSDVAIDQATLTLIGQIQADRNKRVLQASESLQPIIWLAAIGTGVLVVVMTFFLYMDRAWPQLVITATMASIISLLLCITAVLSRPFVGPMALQPEAFEHSLQVFTAVDATP